MTQGNLFEAQGLPPHCRSGYVPRFSGATFSPEHDQVRLSGQLARVREFMDDGCWHRLSEIAEAVGGSEAGVSARLRDCRKAPLSLKVDKRRVSGGLWTYRLQKSGPK